VEYYFHSQSKSVFQLRFGAQNVWLRRQGHFSIDDPFGHTKWVTPESPRGFWVLLTVLTSFGEQGTPETVPCLSCPLQLKEPLHQAQGLWFTISRWRFIQGSLECRSCPTEWGKRKR
jgi:hypothetical protein